MSVAASDELDRLAREQRTSVRAVVDALAGVDDAKYSTPCAEPDCRLWLGHGGFHVAR